MSLRTIVRRSSAGKNVTTHIMARSPTLPDSDDQRLSAVLRDQGCDTALSSQLPQRTGAAPEH
jgi:hypothetical protein